MCNNIQRIERGSQDVYAEQKEEPKSDIVEKFPAEVVLEIFSYLNKQELARCLRVNKKWKAIASDKALWKALLPPRIAFGKKEWAKYLGEIGQEPALPKDIRKILKSPCPIWSGKKVKETHMLVLIPETVNRKLLNLKTLEELVKKEPKEGQATQYCYISKDFINEHGQQGPGKAHWVLMTKNVIEGSHHKSYKEQQALIDELAKKQKLITKSQVC